MRGRVGVATVLVLGLMTAGFSPRAAGTLPLEEHDCNDPIDHSFRLKDDITGCTTHGLRIVADDVTIDLGGHLLMGDGDAADSGINNFDGYDNLRVRNGKIRRFGSGIDIGQNGDGGVMENLVVIGNTDYGIETEEAGQVVRNSLIAANGSLGLEFIGDNQVVTNNIVVGSGNDGIDLNGGDESRLLDNLFINNDGYGIFVEGDRNKIKRNIVVGSGTHGLDINGDENVVEGNSVYGSGLEGIGIDGNSNTVVRNTSTANARGIVVNAGAGNVFNDNIAIANGYSKTTQFDNIGLGMFVGNDAMVSGTGNIARGNDDPFECDIFALCVDGAPGPGGATFSCNAPVTTSIVLGSDLTNCADDGLVVQTSGVTIDLNGHRITSDAAPDPGDHGIDIAPGVTGVTIKGGEVKGFHAGVSGGGSRQSLVDAVVAAAVDNGVALDGRRHAIKRSVIAANRNFGVAVENARDALLSKSTIVFNTLQGIDLGDGEANVVASNRVLANGDTGIALATSEDDEILRNLVYGNGNFGLFANATKRLVSERNKVVGNENSGIFFVTGAKPVIERNKALANGYSNGLANGVGLGIDAADATKPAGTNKARGNDNPAECDPAKLC